MQETYLSKKETQRLKVKGCKTTSHAKGTWKKAGVAKFQRSGLQANIDQKRQ